MLLKSMPAPAIARMITMSMSTTTSETPRSDRSRRRQSDSEIIGRFFSPIFRSEEHAGPGHRENDNHEHEHDDERNAALGSEPPAAIGQRNHRKLFFTHLRFLSLRGYADPRSNSSPRRSGRPREYRCVVISP